MAKNELPETKRQAATAERRRYIVLSAAACFIERGFHQTSVRDIAKKANISLGNLYNHFENKAALIAEIAALEAEELGDIERDLEKHKSPVRTLERFAGSYFDYVALPENAVLAAEITAEAMRNPSIAQGYTQNRERLVTRLVDLLRAGEKQEIFASNAHPEALANLMLDLIESAGSRAAFSTHKSRAQTRNTLIEMVERAICA